MTFHVHINGMVHKFQLARNYLNNSTICKVSVFREDQWFLTIQEECACDANQQFDLWFGRKSTLSKVAAYFTKEIRKTIWDSYLQSISTPISYHLKKDLHQTENAKDCIKIARSHCVQWQKKAQPSKHLHRKQT